MFHPAHQRRVRRRGGETDTQTKEGRCMTTTTKSKVKDIRDLMNADDMQMPLFDGFMVSRVVLAFRGSAGMSMLDSYNRDLVEKIKLGGRVSIAAALGKDGEVVHFDAHVESKKTAKKNGAVTTTITIALDPEDDE